MRTLRVVKDIRKQENTGHCDALDCLDPCCAETIDVHSANNMMLVCGSCKKFIKLYKEQAAYRNYIKFCLSRKRKVQTAAYGDFHVVIQPSLTFN